MRRLKEVLKSLLIILLLLSAAYLAVCTWIYDSSILSPAFYENNAKLLSFLGIDPPSAGAVVIEKSPAKDLVEAAKPIRCAITVSNTPERCGAEYDRTQVDMILAKTADLVGKAIGSASVPEEITERGWRKALSGVGVYYDYLGQIPLSAIALWQNYEPPSHVKALVRRLVLAVEEDGTAIYYENELDHRFYRCQTAVERESLLDRVGTYKPNGCVFAFEANKGMSGAIGELFIFSDSPVLRMASSAPAEDREKVFGTLLDVFDISPGFRRSTQNLNDTLLAVDGSRSLSFSSGCEAIYSDTREGEAGGVVIYVPQSAPSEAEVIENVRAIAEKTAGTAAKEAELYLRNIEYEASGQKYTLTFGYVLNGVPVMLSDFADAAVFRIEYGILTYARIEFREFTLENESYVPMPLRTAILLDEDGADCHLSYKEARDCEPGLMSIGWYK